MTTEQLSDLAFKYTESTPLSSSSVYQYCKDNNIEDGDIDYFLVFVKHWYKNAFELNWSSMYMNTQFDRERANQQI